MSNGQLNTENLHPSNEDIVALGMALQMRYNELIQAHHRITGNKLIIPQNLVADFRRARSMIARHHQQDYRNTVSELKSVRVIAQWTVDVNAKIRNQAPTQIEWSG